MSNGRVPEAGLQDLSRGQILNDNFVKKHQIERQRPESHHGLGVAKVIAINYEEFLVTLRVVVGSSEEFDRVPVPLTLPGAGNRHFLGAMPQVNDYCVVGWMPQESTHPKATQTPVILSWIVPGVWPGRDWLMTQGFSPEEWDYASHKSREVVKGVADRIRHKLRHIQPGNIVASSAQGSDLVLDEGVTLSNRRGDEIRLRDQDQALVARSRQQFHAMAGARLYAGMVQRDASFLSTALISDGYEWDAKTQASLDSPLHESALPPSIESEGFLTPANSIARSETTTRGAAKISPNIDPYEFLQQGGFIDSRGFAITDQSEVVYGGKPIYRVAINGNDFLNKPTFTEWRLEVEHTSQGHLPVTEQTDLFDAEDREPYVQVVYGTVVGNDVKDRSRYGLPLIPQVFVGSSLNPGFQGAAFRSTTETKTYSLGEHAASLLQINHVEDEGVSFSSFTKEGRYKAYVGGVRDDLSAEIAMRGGLKLSLGGNLDLEFNQINLVSNQGSNRDNVGLNLDSNSSVLIRGRQFNTQDDSVKVEGQKNITLEAGKRIQVNSESFDSKNILASYRTSQSMNVQVGDLYSLSSNEMRFTSTGKRVDTYSGPKNALPTNGALHEETYAPLLSVVAKKSTFVLGDREETFIAGSHTTDVVVGNLTYRTAAGVLTASSALNELNITGASTALVGNVGPVSISANAGAVNVTGALTATVSTGGLATVTGGSGVVLGGPVNNNAGPILCAGTLEPLTGLPFATWGLGAPFHRVGV